MRRIIDSIPDWLLLTIGAILGLIAFACYTPTAHGQEVYKISKTTVIVNNDKQHAKQDTVKTNYKIIIDNVAYPVYMTSTSGKMFIVRTSQKTGKQYKVYSIKGRSITKMFK